MSDKEWILLLITLLVLYKLYRWQEAMDQDKRYRPPTPPSYQPNWNQLHSSFDDEYVKQWEQEGYDYYSVRKWMELGVEPNELELVKWIREVKGLSVDYIRNKGQMAELRMKYRLKEAPKDGSIKFYY